MQPIMLSFIISLVIGTVAFFLVFSWRSDSSRILFLMFVGALVFIPAIWLLLSFVVGGPRWFRIRNHWYYEVFTGLAIIYPVLVSSLLLIFVGVKGWQSCRQKPEIIYSGNSRRWDLQLEYQDLLSLMRRREWSFLIDFFLPLLPLLVTVALVFGSQEGTRAEFGFSISLVFSIVAGPIYWLCKDAFGGRSIGKRIADLQTVNALDGRPISAGQSFARNWVFLIPLFPLVELAIASLRKDNLRLGDMLANTRVVQGPANYVDDKLVLDPKIASAKLREADPVDPLAD